MLAQVGMKQIGGSMAVNRDEFFAELDRLTDQQIEERLPLWNREELMMVQQYIDQRTIEPPEEAPKAPEQEQKPVSSERITRDAAVVALAAARKASTMAVSALILSIGAMMAALVAGAIAYLSLNN